MSEMADLREMARHVLEETGDSEQTHHGSVRRAVLDVEIDGLTEIVTLSARNGELRWSSTDSEQDSAYVREALRFMAGHPPAPGSTISTKKESSSSGRESSPRIVDPNESAAAALDDLVTAVIRGGVSHAEGGPSVEDAITRFVDLAPKPTPLSVSRWVGRLRQSLADKDLASVVRCLDGAGRASKDLRADAPSAEQLVRRNQWTRSTAVSKDPTVRLTDRTLVEVARENLDGLSRNQIVRRYLVCVRTGQVFREEASRNARMSVGPCPRRITVGLAEQYLGAKPTRIKLMQYAVSNDVTHADWAALQKNCEVPFKGLVEDYKASVRAYPGMSEPFAVVVPAAHTSRGGLVFYDRAGSALPVSASSSPATVVVLREVLAGVTPAWVAGRLVDYEGSIMIIPASVGVRAGGAVRHVRLT